jgi:hypothetical protein
MYRLPRQFATDADREGWSFYGMMFERHATANSAVRMQRVERKMILEEVCVCE